jgi:hypothetical protein
VNGWCGPSMSFDTDNQRCDMAIAINCKDGERPDWKAPDNCKFTYKFPHIVKSKQKTVFVWIVDPNNNSKPPKTKQEFVKFEKSAKSKQLKKVCLFFVLNFSDLLKIINFLLT